MLSSMRPWARLSARKLTFLVLLMFALPQYAETPAESFPDLLLPEDGSPVPGRPTPEGTFIRNPQDFLLCSGKDFQGMGPAGSYSVIQWQGNSFDDVASFNNETVTELLRDPSNRKNRIVARDRFEAALAADPQFYPFLYNLARLNLLLRDFEESIRLFQKAASLIPDDPGPYMNIARACEELQEHRCVISYYKKAHSKAPLRPDAVFSLGIYYLESDRRPQAEIYIKQGYRDFPDDSRMKIALARLLLQKGDRLKARVLLESIPTRTMSGEQRKDYDLSLHYYLAEIYKDSRDYGAALREINILLANPSAPFFMEHNKQDLQKQKQVLERLARAQSLSED
ncbi:MAG: tetratricopeptide repeat protein [Leptospiraceae bacterium]|nr:tetratricopeptide repeat protein [Leptospiraceae bacterium]